MLRCVHPQHVPNMLDYYGAECIREQRGDAAPSATVAFEEGWWTSTAEIHYRWDPREQLWEYGQEQLQVDDEEGKIDSALRLADLLLEDGFFLEKRFL